MTDELGGTVTPEPDLRDLIVQVLDRNEALDAKLDATNDKLDATDASNRSRQRTSFWAVVAYATVGLLLLAGAGLGYAHNDRQQRCQTRRDLVVTIRSVLATDHDALPDGIIEGFGTDPDTQHVVDVIRAAYDKSEAQLASDFPVPDCSGFLP